MFLKTTWIKTPCGVGVCEDRVIITLGFIKGDAWIVIDHRCDCLAKYQTVITLSYSILRLLRIFFYASVSCKFLENCTWNHNLPVLILDPILQYVIFQYILSESLRHGGQLDTETSYRWYKYSVDISTDNFSLALEPLISSLDPSVKTCIMGDFNINLLEHNLSPPVENFIYKNLMTSKILLPIINRPTRVTPHSCTLIDNIFCNRVDEVESSGVITNISDHYPVFAREKFPTLPEDSTSINYCFFRWELIKL